MKKNDYLLDLYYNGEDMRNPASLPRWFGGLLVSGFVKILADSDKVIITEKGLEYVEALGLVPEHPIHVARNERFQALMDEALRLLVEPGGIPPQDGPTFQRASYMETLRERLKACQRLANLLQ